MKNTAKKTEKETKTVKVQKKRTKSSANPKNPKTEVKAVVVATPVEAVKEPVVEAVVEPVAVPVTEVPVETEKEARVLEGDELKKAIENQTNGMSVIITRSTNGKTQQRVTGSRKFKNPYGHFYGTIGSKIDRLIENSAFTKKQIEAYAGTKMSKVNSHIAHLRKDVKKSVMIDPKTKKVSFG